MPSPALDVLLTASGPPATARRLEPDPAEPELVSLYAPPSSPWLRANMISTLDGAATGADGRSGSINGDADLRVFEVLRSLADVVLVGAGTARAEGYGPLRTAPGLLPGRTARGQAPHPALALVTARGAVPDALLRTEPEDAPYVVTVAGSPGLADLRRLLPPDRLLVHDDEVDLARAVHELGDRGLAQVLAEGGPSLLGDLLAAGLVDELCLTTSPVVVGGPAPRVVNGQDWLAVDAAPDLLLHAGGVVLGRWVLRRHVPAAPRRAES